MQTANLVESPEQAIVLHQPEPTPATTAAQAKIDAVAHLTMKAYERASTLQMTPEETKALGGDFPDEAFKPGAAGKDHLLYIEHAFLRDRLNLVFGPGQWSIIPRNRWSEPFKTKNNVAGERIYVEAMLLIRGCFVSESVCSKENYPSNGQQDYGDAVEGAKTAALRRCCKELGIGLQAWKKDWGDGWWQRHRGNLRSPAPKDDSGYLPSDGGDLGPQKNLGASGDTRIDGRNADKPASKQANVASVGTVAKDDGGWRAFPCPFGKNSGIPLGKLSEKSIEWYISNFVVTFEYNGKPKRPETIAKDKAFKAALDAAKSELGIEGGPE